MSGDAGLLAALEALQARFIGAVRGADWPAAQELERQRFAVMDALLREGPLTPALAAELAAMAQADRALLPQVEAALAESAQALRELRNGRQALRAYAAGR